MDPLSNIRVSAAIVRKDGDISLEYDHHRLRIKILDHCVDKEFVRSYYTSKIDSTYYYGDSGVDLVFPEDVTMNKDETRIYGFGIAAEFIPAHCSTSRAYWLTPRSSISKTPIRQSNNPGLMDGNYRGEIMMAMDMIKENGRFGDHYTAPNGDKCYKRLTDYTIKKGDRLCQIVAPDTNPIVVELVEELSSTQRGSNGFGSTNLPIS